MAGQCGDREGFDPLAAALDELRVLEARIRGVEDVLTSGDAQSLPAAPRARVARDPDLQRLELALTLGALARRMNMRLGAIERALEGRGAIGFADLAQVRPRRRLRLSKPARPRGLSAEVPIRIVRESPPGRPN